MLAPVAGLPLRLRERRGTRNDPGIEPVTSGLRIPHGLTGADSIVIVPKPCDHDSRPLYDQLIEPLRDVARNLGYALGVHGTLRRDIDLIACPWAWNAVPAKTLAKAIQHKAREIVGYAEPCRSDARSSNPKYFRDGLMGFAPKVGLIAAKPHGRKSWAFHLTPTQDGPYIDLSVMPRRIQP